MVPTVNSTASQSRFALHNACMGTAIIAYSLWIGPCFSPYSRPTPFAGVDYLKDVVRVGAVYLLVDSIFRFLNYVDACVLLVTTAGFLYKRKWAPTLTFFWALYTIALAIIAVLVHYVFVAVPESQMLHDVTRGDAFQTRLVEITTRMLFLASACLPVAVVIDAFGTLGYLQANRLSNIQAVIEMLGQWAQWTRSRCLSLYRSVVGACRHID